MCFRSGSIGWPAQRATSPKGRGRLAIVLRPGSLPPLGNGVVGLRFPFLNSTAGRFGVAGGRPPARKSSPALSRRRRWASSRSRRSCASLSLSAARRPISPFSNSPSPLVYSLCSSGRLQSVDRRFPSPLPSRCEVIPTKTSLMTCSRWTRLAPTARLESYSQAEPTLLGSPRPRGGTGGRFRFSKLAFIIGAAASAPPEPVRSHSVDAEGYPCSLGKSLQRQSRPDRASIAPPIARLPVRCAPELGQSAPRVEALPRPDLTPPASAEAPRNQTRHVDHRRASAIVMPSRTKHARRAGTVLGRNWLSAPLFAPSLL